MQSGSVSPVSSDEQQHESHREREFFTPLPAAPSPGFGAPSPGFAAAAPPDTRLQALQFEHQLAMRRLHQRKESKAHRESSRQREDALRRELAAAQSKAEGLAS
eukprot:6536546-Prymnesium_polylepis.1